MSIELSFDAQDLTVAGRVTVPPHQVDVPSGNPETLNNPDLSQVQGLDVKYWKVFPPQIGGQVIPMIQQEIAAWDAKVASDLNLSQRSAAFTYVDSPVDIGKLHRAVADVLISEINILREWQMSFKAAVAGAATLAALKTAVAALPELPDRTLSQAKTAIKNDINSGNVD